MYRSVDEPYILVDFGNPVTWDEAASYCENQLGSQLAGVWRNQTTVYSEQEQIDLMVTLCEGDGTAEHPGAGEDSCWIGLRYYQTGSEFFRWLANGQYLDDDSLTHWIPGTNPPTAYFFQAYGEDTVCCL